MNEEPQKPEPTDESADRPEPVEPAGDRTQQLREALGRYPIPDFHGAKDPAGVSPDYIGDLELTSKDGPALLEIFRYRQGGRSTRKVAFTPPRGKKPKKRKKR